MWTCFDEVLYQVRHRPLTFNCIMWRTGIPVFRIEKIAKILEKRGLVEIHYPIIGTPRVERVRYDEENKALHFKTA